jgi:uncharacterized repeat protein (TIGR03806 family)
MLHKAALMLPRRSGFGAAARRVASACALLQLLLACGSDPPRPTAQGGSSGATASGGAGGQMTGTSGLGGVAQAGDAPNVDISPPFNPTPPVPLTAAWSGTIVAEYSENYTFRVTANSPVRALVNGEQILRDWTAQGPRVAVGSVWLAAGTTYPVAVEAADAADSTLRVEWESPSKPRGVVPKSTAADQGLAKLTAVAPFFNGVFPKKTPSSAAVSPKPVSGNLGLTTVMGIASHPNLPHLYIVGRNGPIKYIDPSLGNDVGKVFIDLSQGLFTGQDSGVMNMVFHPEYAKAGSANRNYFYVFYVADSGGAEFVRVSRFTATEGQNSANRSTEQILIQERLPGTLHRGGGMAFGKDGFLYIGLGDYGNPNNGQDISNHLAAGVIRIDVDQNPQRSHAIPRDTGPTDDQSFNRNYFIPNDNPFVGQAGVLEEYYTLGERNPHRLTMDRLTGRIFIGNVGGNEATSQEEVNEVVKGGNYGWPFREGDQELGSWTFGGFQVPGRPSTIVGTLTEPNLFYERPNSCPGVATQCPDLGNVQEGKCVIGGYVYRGSALPKLDGRYLLSDCTNGKIWASADERGHGPLEELFTSPFIEVVTFGEDRDGEVYFGGTGGQVYRLEPSGPPVADPPPLLSQTGVFADLATLTPSPSVIPYDVSSALWSDAAKKARWMIVPNDGTADTAAEQIDVAADGSWTFPVGSVFVKHFELEQANGAKRRLETRFLVHAEEQRYYGVTYRWRPDHSDAELQGAKAFRETVGEQAWHYPSRSECGQCHNSSANFVLGLKTAQFNKPTYYASSGLTANALQTLQGLGLFKTPLMPASLPQMPSLHEGTAFAQERARGYLDSNCAHCHRPEGPGRGEFDLRYSTALSEQQIVDGEVIEGLGIADAKLLSPQKPDSSIIFKRLSALDGTAMPPLAKGLVDASAVSVFSAWLAAVNLQSKPTPPTASDDKTLTVAANGEAAVALIGSDPDGDALDFRVSRMPVHGTLTGVGKNLTYRPHPDFAGIDGFTFTVRDGANESKAATVQLTVTNP